jgi:hypothetical protein
MSKLAVIPALGRLLASGGIGTRSSKRHRIGQDGKPSDPEKMRQRAALCEHPFGTLKLWCGWTHFLLRGLDKVRAEMNLMMWSYNFKRVLNILGLEAFQAYCLVRGSHKPLRI